MGRVLFLWIFVVCIVCGVDINGLSDWIQTFNKSTEKGLGLEESMPCSKKDPKILYGKNPNFGNPFLASPPSTEAPSQLNTVQSQSQAQTQRLAFQTPWDIQQFPAGARPDSMWYKPGPVPPGQLWGSPPPSGLKSPSDPSIPINHHLLFPQAPFNSVAPKDIQRLQLYLDQLGKERELFQRTYQTTQSQLKKWKSLYKKQQTTYYIH